MAKHGRTSRLVLALAGTASLVAAATPLAAANARAATGGLHAVIHRTEYGIPHITADDFASLGYGFGYAFAQDDICVMADDYVTVDGQRSQYFGAGGTYTQGGNGETTSNLDSDVFWKSVDASGVIEHLLTLPSPPAGQGLRPEVRDAVRGYVAGWNRYLGDAGGAAGIPDPTCRGAAWVHPITEIEAYRRFYQLILLASQGVAVAGIAEAQPPAGAGPSASLDVPALVAGLARNLHPDVGSNAVALGSAGTRDGRGLLLGNPHFPWYGTERFYEAQLTIPGVMNVEGAMLYGVPVVLIGHTDTLAWSHTVSTAYRFTPYQLTLVPGSPTTYLQDGVPTAMTSRTVTVQVRGGDGTLSPVSRTLWSTRYGPMLSSIVGIPLPWTPATGFTLRDANADNFRVFNHFLETDMAHSASDELGILEKYEGIPWVNTIVADSTGHALYADIGAVPNVTDTQARTCSTAAGQALFAAVGLPILDGSRTACDWGTDADAVEPGLFGPSHLPHLFRSDYVTNSNDSYWLSNPKQPLTGYSRIIGDEGTERSLRTRIGLMMTQARVDGSDGLGPAGFTRQDMQTLEFSDRVLSAELTRDDLVSLCRSFPGGMAPTSSGPPVPVGNSCDVLAAWNMRDSLTARGALLFRLFWDNAVANTTEAGRVGAPDSPAVFLHPFDSTDPVHTPNTLDVASPVVQTAFGDALSWMQSHGVAVDEPLGTRQGVIRQGAFIPLHGGVGDPNGDFDAIYSDFDSTTQKWLVSDGSSYIQVVHLDGSPCPDVRTILTYSLSTNPDSPHAADQTRLFSAGQWVTERFCQADVLASPDLQTTVLDSGGTLAAAAVAGLRLPDTSAGSAGAAAAVVAACGLPLLGIRRLRRR